MKRVFLSFILAGLCLLAAAQVPESFSYQVVVRDVSYNPMTNQDVSFRLSILKGSSSGVSQYSELHSANTGALGIVNLVIGNGNGKTGNFTTIDWGADSYFLKVEIDHDGNAAYDEMGSIQLISVPYSLYSKTTDRLQLKQLTSSEILALSPETGQMVYNTTTGNLLLFNGTAWSAIEQECWPPVDLIVNSGSDQSSSSGNLVLNLDGSVPNFGTGTWTIVSGTGGSFGDIHSPTTLFYADLYVPYQLRWTITTLCGSSYDDMLIIPEAAPYAHTITIDGTNDFIVADERFITTSTGYYTYYSWDATYLYLGFKGPDINSGSSTKYLVLYISGTPGTTTGRIINTQQPTLPFSAGYNILWRASGDFFQGFSYNGSSWQISSIVGPSDISRSGDFIEMRIPLAMIGSPGSVSIHVNMLSEAAGFEGTYAGAPSNSFTDSYDPNYMHYFEFTFLNGAKPNQYVPQK